MTSSIASDDENSLGTISLLLGAIVGMTIPRAFCVTRNERIGSKAEIIRREVIKVARESRRKYYTSKRRKKRQNKSFIVSRENIRVRGFIKFTYSLAIDRVVLGLVVTLRELNLHGKFTIMRCYIAAHDRLIHNIYIIARSRAR